MLPPIVFPEAIVPVSYDGDALPGFDLESMSPFFIFLKEGQEVEINIMNLEKCVAGSAMKFLYAYHAFITFAMTRLRES